MNQFTIFNLYEKKTKYFNNIILICCRIEKIKKGEEIKVEYDHNKTCYIFNQIIIILPPPLTSSIKSTYITHQKKKKNYLIIINYYLINNDNLIIETIINFANSFFENFNQLIKNSIKIFFFTNLIFIN